MGCLVKSKKDSSNSPVRKQALSQAGTKPDVRVIFMSGYTGDVIIGKGIIEKEYAFIQKPLSPNELLLRVKEVLSR